MSRNSSRERVAEYFAATDIPDVDVIQETWNPTKAQFDAYKRREVEMACMRQASIVPAIGPAWTMDLFSYDTWLRALIGVGW